MARQVFVFDLKYVLDYIEEVPEQLKFVQRAAHPPIETLLYDRMNEIDPELELTEDDVQTQPPRLNTKPPEKTDEIPSKINAPAEKKATAAGKEPPKKSQNSPE